MLGWYNLEITGPTGKHIYSGKKFLSAGNAQKLNIIHLDLSVLPPKASLVPFKGPKADEMKGARGKGLHRGQRTQPGRDGCVARRQRADFTLQRNRPGGAGSHQSSGLETRRRAAATAVEIAPYKWELYQNLGTIQRNLEQYSGAVASFEKGIQVLGESPEAKQDRAKTNAEIALMSRSAKAKPWWRWISLRKQSLQFRSAAEFGPNPARALPAFVHRGVQQRPR